MVNLQLIEFKKDHAHLMVNAIMNDPMTQIDDKYHEYLDGLEVPGMSFTAIKDDKIIMESMIDPNDPEIVLCGLIFVNFGPFNNFPKIYPPMSEATHVNKITKIKIFRYTDDDRTKKAVQK